MAVNCIGDHGGTMMAGLHQCSSYGIWDRGWGPMRALEGVISPWVQQMRLAKQKDEGEGSFEILGVVRSRYFELGKAKGTWRTAWRTRCQKKSKVILWSPKVYLSSIRSNQFGNSLWCNQIPTLFHIVYQPLISLGQTLNTVIFEINPPAQSWLWRLTALRNLKVLEQHWCMTLW